MFLYTSVRTAAFDKSLKRPMKTKHNNIVILLLINRAMLPITIRYEYCKLNLILSCLWNATLQQVFKCLKHSRRLSPSSNIKSKPFFNLINLTESKGFFSRGNYSTIRRENETSRLLTIVGTWSISTIKYKGRKIR